MSEILDLIRQHIAQLDEPPLPTGKFAEVVLANGPPKPLTYAIPQGMEVEVGASVKVPVQGSTRFGVVTSLPKSCEFANVRPIEAVEEGLPEELLKLSKWIEKYYLATPGQVLRTMMPTSVRKGTQERQQMAVRRGQTREKLRQACIAAQNRAPAQARLLEVLLKTEKEILLTELLEKAEASRSSLKALEEQGYVQCFAMGKLQMDPFPSQPKRLNEEQEVALKTIREKEGFATFLLYGITGSGKTEVYLQAIQDALDANKSAIVLVPEIALTEQTVQRFRSRFGEKIALLHHRLSDGERAEEWRRIRSHEASIAIGPRSAIFAPMANLGLIVVDEEHEGSYKQSDAMPHYHARDVAIMRGHFSGAKVILGSATPSLESMHNCNQGKYTLLKLMQRADNAALPKVRILDMRESKSYLLSDQLINAIAKRHKVGEQSILFLNRRGYNAMQWCPECREPVQCDHCSVSMTFHRNETHLLCHLCGHTSQPHRKCPSCKSGEPMKFRGAGTEQVERALKAVLPDVRSLRMDADTTRHKGSHEKLLRLFRSGKAEVLIGTQMVAKGLHFPQVTLVGILNSDPALQIPDIRAAERTFQLITQVAGRAGRGQLKGEVLIQSRMPTSQTIQLAAAQDYDAFYKEEIEGRQACGFPPFTRLTKVSLSGPDENLTFRYAQALQEAQPNSLPVTPSGHAKIKDRYRFHFLIKGRIAAPPKIDLPKDLRMDIDVDPLSTFF